MQKNRSTIIPVILSGLVFGGNASASSDLQRFAWLQKHGEAAPNGVQAAVARATTASFRPLPKAFDSATLKRNRPPTGNRPASVSTAASQASGVQGGQRQNIGAEGGAPGAVVWRHLDLVCGVTYRFTLIKPEADSWRDFRLGIRAANLPGPSAPMRVTLVSGVPSDGQTVTVSESLCTGSSRIVNLETYSEWGKNGTTRVAVLDPAPAPLTGAVKNVDDRAVKCAGSYLGVDPKYGQDSWDLVHFPNECLGYKPDRH